MRRKVRSILRQERERASMTQKAAADRVLWSLSKLIRLESGVGQPAPADVRVLLLEYGVEEKRVAEVVEIAKAARHVDEWESYKAAISPEARNLFANESAAEVIEKFEPTLIPGLLQTQEYADGITRALGYPESQAKKMVEARMLRQELLETPDSPRLDFIIGEAALSRPVGGNAVMLAQIEKLKTMTTRKNIRLRLLPFSKGPHVGMGSAFTILQFRDADLPDLVYLESVDKESTVRDDKDEVAKYNERFVLLGDLAGSPDQFPSQLDDIAGYRFRHP
jgi:transcriptional regulator with XRE-family HTH domain